MAKLLEEEGQVDRFYPSPFLGFRFYFTLFFQEGLNHLDSNQNYIKAFLKEKEIEGNERIFSDKQLIITMVDFFTGGSGTMSKTM